MSMRFGGRNDLTGERRGSWTAIERRSSNPKTLQARWLVRCECGYERVKDAQEFKRSGNSCVKCVDRSIHGMSDTYLYRAWRAMKQRCSPGNALKKARYYDRGIAVCEQWANDFPAFARYVLRYLGERPSDKHSIDRRNNDKGYAPGNLRWATASLQNYNTERSHIGRGLKKVIDKP